MLPENKIVATSRPAKDRQFEEVEHPVGTCFSCSGFCLDRMPLWLGRRPCGPVVQRLVADSSTGGVLEEGGNIVVASRHGGRIWRTSLSRRHCCLTLASICRWACSGSTNIHRLKRWWGCLEMQVEGLFKQGFEPLHRQLHCHLGLLDMRDPHRSRR